MIRKVSKKTKDLLRKIRSIDITILFCIITEIYYDEEEIASTFKKINSDNEFNFYENLGMHITDKKRDWDKYLEMIVKKNNNYCDRFANITPEEYENMLKNGINPIDSSYVLDQDTVDSDTNLPHFLSLDIFRTSKLKSVVKLTDGSRTNWLRTQTKRLNTAGYNIHTMIYGKSQRARKNLLNLLIFLVKLNSNLIG